MMRIIPFLSLVLISLGCAMKPTRYDQQPEGQWQAKALIRDLKANKSAVVHLDISAIQGEKLRLDVTAALGQPVASLLLMDDRLVYVLMESKEYYVGKATKAALGPVLAVPMDPHILYSLVFDKPIEEKSWSCSKDNKGYLLECQLADGSTKVRWSQRKGSRKTVFVEHARASLQINFSGFRSKVESKNETFQLKPPQSFTPIQL